MPSTRLSCSLVSVTVSVSLMRVGWTFSVVLRTLMRVSSRILPAFPITLPRRNTRNANARAAIIPAMSPKLTSMRGNPTGTAGARSPEITECSATVGAGPGTGQRTGLGTGAGPALEPGLGTDSDRPSNRFAQPRPSRVFSQAHREASRSSKPRPVGR